MSIPAKETVALEQEELDVLDAIRQAAPRHRIKPKLAQAYGVWTICFRRYCQEEGMPWLWMSSVSDFMDFLDAHPNVSPAERDRALDGIMFYISDVHKRQKEKAEDEDEGSDVPRSTQSLFARMLLRCDVQLTEVLHLRRDDVQLEESTLKVSGHPEHDSRTISLPWTLEEGLKQYVQRVEERTTSTNPLLFGHRGRPGDDAEESASTATDEDIERSTEVATRVMKTFGSKSPRDEDGEE